MSLTSKMQRQRFVKKPSRHCHVRQVPPETPSSYANPDVETKDGEAGNGEHTSEAKEQSQSRGLLES